MTCSYCAQPVTDVYCSHCGQRVISRFSWDLAITWLQEELFVLDRGFFYTVKELLFHPVALVNNYLRGVTKKYFNPFKLLIILATAPIALLLIFSNNDTNFGTIMREAPPAFTSASFRYLFEQWPLLMIPNLIYHVTVTSVLIAGACRLLFKKTKFNYLEHLIVICFMASFLLLLTYCTLPIWAFGMQYTPEVTLIILTPAWIMVMIYMIFVFSKIHHYSFGATLLRGLAGLYGAMILSILLQLLILSIIKSFF